LLRSSIAPVPGNDRLLIDTPSLFPLFLRYHSAISKVRLLLAQPNPEPPFICVLLGESGAGKSRFVKEYCAPYYRFSSSEGWFDGYDGEDTLYIDDMDGSSMKFRLLLQILDSNCPRTKVKGGFVQLYIREVYITTNVHPINWYDPRVTARNRWDLSHPLCRRLEQFGELRFVPPYDRRNPFPPPGVESVGFRNPAFYHYGRKDLDADQAPGFNRRGGMVEDLYGLNLANE